MGGRGEGGGERLLVQECMWRYVCKDEVLAFVSISRYLTAISWKSLACLSLYVPNMCACVYSEGQAKL